METDDVIYPENIIHLDIYADAIQMVISNMYYDDVVPLMTICSVESRNCRPCLVRFVDIT